MIFLGVCFAVRETTPYPPYPPPPLGKMTMKSQFVDMTYRQFFWRCHVFPVNFSYWSKFHVNIITGSGVMTILVYKRLTRIWKSEILPSGFFPISGNCGELWIPNLAPMSLISYWILQKLLNSVKHQGYNIYRFLVTRGKSTGGNTPLHLD